MRRMSQFGITDRAAARSGTPRTPGGLVSDETTQRAVISADQQRLHELGYAQELRRHMSGFSNFAVSFTIISILSGCLTLYGTGMTDGGPVIITWGWPFVGIMTLFVGLAMAEVCSSFPTAGGLYYWSAKLAPRNAAAWSWFTGWVNFLGQVAVTAGIDFGAALFLNALLDIQWGFDTRPWHTIVLLAAILILHGLLNSFGVRLVALLNNVSVWWHIIGVLLIVGVLAIAPSHHQSASFVFTHYVNNTGWSSWIYVALLGLLLAQYTFTGYDASAHMTEETKSAAVAGPRAETFIDAVGATGGKLLLVVVIVAQLFCGMSSVTANSRMIYAFSRDGALPGSAFWHRVNPQTRTPTNGVWLAATGALILALPYLWNSVAYYAVTSIAVIGLYVAYVIPTFLRLRLGSAFNRGPWHLGRWSRPIGTIAVIWVVF